MFGILFGLASVLATVFLVVTSKKVQMKHAPSYETPGEVKEETIQPPQVKGLPGRRLMYLYLLFGVIQTTVGYILYAHNDLFPIFGVVIHLYLQMAVFVNMYRQFRFKQLKPLWYRILLSWPSAFYLGTAWFALPSLLLLPFLGYITDHARVILSAITFTVGAFGMYQSLANPTFCGEEVHIDLTDDSQMKQSAETTPHLYRVIGYRNPVQKERKLNIFQITDPHLGPFMSVRRLENICKNIVQAVKEGKIDLVFFTGDMETVETHDDDHALVQALAPLKELANQNKLFGMLLLTVLTAIACLGNHDYENLKRIRDAMTSNGIVMLEDQETAVDTRLGRVQIIGSVYTYAGEVGSHEHVKNLCKKYPRHDNVIARFMLIHNPSIFPHIPPEENVCVFSGHLHGGQIGIGTYTLVNLVSRSSIFLKRMKQEFPDQGLYNKGKNLLYTHRGTGHYGFPLRLGIPSEQSIIRVHV